MSPITIHGVVFSMKGLIFTAAAAQWLLILLIAVVTPGRRGAWKKSEIVLVISTMLFGSVWYGLLRPARPPLVEASMAGGSGSHHGSCDTVHPGDGESTVKQKLGNPDHIRGEEDTRGPAAEVWIYEDTRCAVHLYGDRVDSVE